MMNFAVPTAATASPPVTISAPTPEGQVFSLLDLLQLGSGCNPEWKSDGTCDLACNTAEEGFDSGDCDAINAGTACEYTDDGECDEITWCAAGTDTADCCAADTGRADFISRVKVWLPNDGATGNQRHDPYMCNCPEDRVQGRVLGKPISAGADCS